MKYRKLGRTGIEVSEIGYGTWGIGGTGNGAYGYGPTDDEVSKQAVSLSLEKGVNFFETAPLYGYGHCETLLGECFQSKREQVIISSKVGYVDFSGKQEFSATEIRASLEGSLQRLNTDYVDLFQLYDPPRELLQSDNPVFETLRDLKKEGKTRSIGVSAKSPDDGLIAAKNIAMDFVQVNFNLVDQRAKENGLFQLAKEKELGMIVRTPLCFGFLTGRYSKSDQYDQYDHRSKWSGEQIDKWAAAITQFQNLLDLEQDDLGPQLALRYCLSFAEISTLIPGMLTPQHVEENVSSSELEHFNISEIEKINDFYRNNSFFVSK